MIIMNVCLFYFKVGMVIVSLTALDLYFYRYIVKINSFRPDNTNMPQRNGVNLISSSGLSPACCQGISYNNADFCQFESQRKIMLNFDKYP